MHLEEFQGLLQASADVSNFVYQCEISEWLRPCFTFEDALPREEARELFGPREHSVSVFPALRVLPVGLKKAFFFAQRFHEHLLAQVGLRQGCWSYFGEDAA